MMIDFWVSLFTIISACILMRCSFSLNSLTLPSSLSVNIPTGVPLVYSLDNNLNVVKKEYLLDEDKLKEKQNIVANQGKAK